MPTIWLISDTHFGHQNIIDYCNRPFANAKEMDEAMADRWAEVVRPGDKIYHLGDVGMNNQGLEIIKKLPGHKRLVLGNHDCLQIREYLAAGFEDVYGVRQINGVWLSHVPMHPMSVESHRVKGNFHGHIHDIPAPPGKYLNLCVEWTDYRPITLEDAVKRLEAKLAREHMALLDPPLMYCEEQD